MPGGSARGSPVDHGNHTVLFYGDDAELAASVRSFLGHGLAGGGSAALLATPARRAAVALASPATTGRLAGRLLMADAAGMRRGFLVSDRPA